VLYEVAKGMITGRMPDVGTMHRVEGRPRA
jgi:hypothetical protein